MQTRYDDDKKLSTSAIARNNRVSAKRMLEDEFANEASSKKVKALLDDGLSLGGSETVDVEEDATCHQLQDRTVDSEVQCNILTSCQYMRLERYTDDTKAFKYLTGLDGHEHFKLIFTILGPACYELNYQSKQLSPENELFLTLVKLCHVLDHL